MANAPAYTTVPGKLGDLLEKIRRVGVPDAVTYDWLKSLGFKSSNDRSLVAVLKYIGFVDASGAPTPAWRQYRGKDHAKVLGRAIVEGYSELYALYPDAHERDVDDLAHWFSTKTNAGQQVISKSVNTFKNLAAHASFEDDDAVGRTMPNASSGGVSEESPTRDDETPTPTPAPAASASTAASRTTGALTVNLNVQLTLPDTTDQSVFDALFKSMRKHLLLGDTSE